LKCKEKKESKNILFVLDANSHLDLSTFEDFMDGSLENLTFSEVQLQESISKLPDIRSD